MKIRLSPSSISKLKPKDKPYEAVDETLKGFLARVQPTGRITYYLSYRTLDGTRRRFRIGTHPNTTAPAARKRAEKLAAEVTQGGDPQFGKKQAIQDRQRDKHQTLKYFLEYRFKDWVNTHHRRGEESFRLLQRNFEFLYSKKLTEITSWDIEKFRMSRKKAGYKAASINRCVTTLKAALNRAVDWGLIDSNPLRTVKPLKLDSNPVVRYLSHKEEKQLRNVLHDRDVSRVAGRQSGNNWRKARNILPKPELRGPYSDHVTPIVLLVLNTGIRRAEVFNLCWTDVDLDRKAITIRGEGAKSGHTRHIPLNSEALGILRTMHSRKDKGLVFSNPTTGNAFNNIKYSWTQIIRKANIENFRFHDLRHTFASKLVMSGIDLYTVSKLMGHASIKMTERYAHLAPEHQALAVESLVSSG